MVKRHVIILLREPYIIFYFLVYDGLDCILKASELTPLGLSGPLSQVAHKYL